MQQRNDLKAIVDSEIQDAIGYLETETVEARRDALRSYLRKPYGNEVEGKSSIVTGEVAEAIDGALPSLVRIFTGSDEITQFDPVAQRDEASAKQATDYCNYVFLKENNGAIILHDWIKDALLQKVGIVKAYWEDKIDVSKETYEGLSDDEITILLSDNDIEIAEQVTEQFPFLDQMGMQVLDETGMPVTYGVHNVTIKHKEESGKVTIENVPPEEFLISKRAKTIDDAPFVAHRRNIRRGDLIAMGFDEDIVETLSASSGLIYQAELLTRYDNSEVPDDNALDESMQEVEVFECYLRTDQNGDGIPELRQVFFADNKILSDEECDYIPFYSICPIPIPHKFFGQSLADRTMDIQLIKTTIMRQTLDNLYLTNNARVVAIEGQVNLDDLLTSTAGGVIRAKSQGAVQQLVVQNVAAQSFPMLEYLDQVQAKRTGVSDASQGLDASVLQNVTAAAIASMQQSGAGKIEMIARIFAETGVRSLFKGIMHLVTKYQNKEKIIRLRGEYIPIDPRTWATAYDVTVNVGIGAGGNRQEQMATLNMISTKQEQMLAAYGPANPFVSPAQYRNTLGRMVEAAGFKDSNEFYKPITPEQDQQLSNPPPQQQPQQDPAMQMAQAKMQADLQMAQAKMQAEIQLQQVKAEAQIDLERQKAAAELQLEREKFAMQTKQAEAEFVMKTRQKEAEFQAEVQIKTAKAMAGLQTSGQIIG